MFETIDYTELKTGESYFIRISNNFGYKGKYNRMTMNFLMFENVELFEFISKNREKMHKCSEEYCLFSRYDTYLRVVSREEYMNKLKEMHERFMTNKILQTIIDENFKYIKF
jgi:hypothetical protein